MAFRKLNTWFLSKSGRQFSYIFAGAISAGVLVANSLPHSVLIKTYRDFLHLYKNGIAVNLSDKLKTRFQKALELAEIDEDDKHLFEPFAAYGFNMVSAGTSYSRFGVFVGLPANLSYEDVSDVDTSKIKINLEAVHWETDEAKSFLNSLILSEKAQLYAMAREIKMRDSPKVLFDAIYATIPCLGIYGISSYLNKKLNLYNRPLLLRFTMYGLVCLFMLGNYVFAKDMTQLFYEQSTDKFLKQKSPILADGGKEFYQKNVQRNVAMRKLLGKDGENIYTVLGNENYIFRQRHLPLVDRKLFFEKSEQEEVTVTENPA